MSMSVKSKSERVRQAVESGSGASTVFWRSSLQSLVELWKHDGQFILTWEEAPDGAQFDESRYTKDERHVFSQLEEVFVFLEQHNLSLDQFELNKSR